MNSSSFFNRLSYFFVRPSIVKKILFGYISLAALIIIISVYSLLSLQRLNEMNESIVQQDVQVIETTRKMIDNLFTQELYARRYFILNSSEMLELFREKNKEFERMAEKIRSLSGEYTEPASRLISLHTEYNSLFLNVRSPLHTETFDTQIKQKQDELIGLIKEVSSQARSAQQEKVLMTEKIGTRAFKVASILCGAGIILSIGAALMITRSISRSVNQLKQATEQISAGRFEYTSDNKNRDELGDLSRAFTEMAKRLRRLEEIYLDTSPLTYLPGNVTIEKELIKRINAGSPSAFCLVDLDNFKPFNDRYSYVKGSEIIKATARIIDGVIKESGTREDFIGHIGGDDFVFITSLDRYTQICNDIIKRFDEMIVNFYDPEDQKHGYIISKNRQGVEMQFPIITISIAVVTIQQGKFRDHIKVGEKAAELKEYAKSIPGSVYVVDRRQETGQTNLGKNVIRFSRRSVWKRG